MPRLLFLIENTFLHDAMVVWLIFSLSSMSTDDFQRHRTRSQTTASVLLMRYTCICDLLFFSSLARYILLDTNHFCWRHKVQGIDSSFTIQLTREIVEENVHKQECVEFIQKASLSLFFFFLVRLFASLSLVAFFLFLFLLCCGVGAFGMPMSTNDGGLNSAGLVVMAAVLVHETWWQVEAMDNRNWWIEVIQLQNTYINRCLAVHPPNRNGSEQRKIPFYS